MAKQSKTEFLTKKVAQQIAYDYAVSRFRKVAKGSEPFSFMGCCPGHDDHTASLSVKITLSGKLLAKCHAGCIFREVITAAGIELFRGIPIVEVYQYHDENNELVYEVCRTADKQFPPRLPNGKWGCDGLSLLYRLPELLEVMEENPEDPVFICEGEKDVNRCWNEGLLPATTVRGGAGGKWRPEFSQTLAGRDIVIFADNDAPGLQFAHRIAKELYGIAKSVKVVVFNDHPEHGDISDFLDAGGTANEVYDRIEQSELWSPDSVPEVAWPAESKSDRTISGIELTDLWAARLFVRWFKNDVLYCPDWGYFLVFDGSRWVRDLKGVVNVFAKQIADAVWEYAQRNVSGEARRFAVRVASARGIQSILTLVQSEQEIVIHPNQFDTDPMLLNCPDGTVDLRKGERRPHRREDFITKLCPTRFNPNAKADRWDETLEKIFDGDEELIGFVQRLFGYCLTGSVSEQVIVIFVGSGSNGKSLILLVLLGVVGSDYFIKASDDILLRKFAQAHPTALADLFGKRLAIVMETDAGDRLAVALIKSLVGGDRIRARRMREDFWEFPPTHKIILCTNHKPTVEATDHAFWRRIRLVPFIVAFWKAGDPGNAGKKLLKRLKADPQLAEKLAAEAEGILAWCVRGCLAWQMHGLGTTDAVAAATESYRREQDALSRFIDECCELEKNARVRSSTLYTKYRAWCESNGEQHLSQNFFKEKLMEQPAGITTKRSDGVWFVGIALLKTK
ncbi:MAG: hypothetical protein JSS49_28170 [Planctomycetes bacterium]|nr:hypothetical protein [Planctomycetota bacterium]